MNEQSDSPYSFNEPPVIPRETRAHLGGGSNPGLTGFEKFCAVIAFLVAIPLMLLGVIGVFLGCSANFTLPPILGVLPAFAAWGIIRPIIKVWK